MKTLNTYAAILALILVGCGPENTPNDPCANVQCGEHGECSSGSCTCDLGWGGNMCENELCNPNPCPAWQDCRLLDGECVGNDPCDPNPCNENGTCTGIAIGQADCTCVPGYTGNTCDVCTDGYKDYPICVEDKCHGVDCGSNGTCNPSTGSCDCVTGWGGTYCDECAGGYHPADSTCVIDEECLGNSCSNSGTCSIVDGLVDCSCNTGYTGTNCELCDSASGYHRSSDGVTCTTNACDPDPSCDDGNVCNGTETCDPVNGCQNGSALTCDDGLVCNGVESCDPSTGCTNPADVDCGSNGSCVETPVAGACECTGNWDPSTSCAGCLTGWEITSDCTTCASGYHDESGTCVINEVCNSNSCNSHGTCEDSSGIIVCSCTGGWTGDYCDVVPAPMVNNLAIDCGVEPCWGGGTTYPVAFSATNATSCIASAVNITGIGTLGSTSGCTIVDSSGSFTYTTGSTAGSVIRITVTVYGPGGEISDYIDITLE